MASVQLVAVIKIRWWVYAYIAGLALVCRIARTEPDWGKVEKVVCKGVITKVEARLPQ